MIWVEDPKLKDATDAIIKVTSTAFCGSDLHMYSGAIPQPRPMVMGHEFMGIVEELRSGVKDLKVGDRVLMQLALNRNVACFTVQKQLSVLKKVL